MKRLLPLVIGVLLFVLVGCQKTEKQALSGGSPQIGARPQLDERGLIPARTDVTVKVNSSRETSTLAPIHREDGPLSAEAGKKLLIVNISVSNNGEKAITLEGVAFRLLASDKMVYYGDTGEPIAYAQLTPLTGQLLSGGSSTGDVIFEIPSGANLGTVEMESRN